MIKYNIPDYYFEKFCENESYDIRKYIKNNQTKFDVTVTYPSQFPSWFLQFKYLRGYQLMGWAFLTGGLISLLFFITLISLAYTHLQSSWYIYLWRSCWFFFALFIVLLILFLAFYLYSFVRYNLYNKTYLNKYLTIFKQMQKLGAIEQNLNQYPLTLQMAFYSRKEWKKANKHLRYCSWFGILSLKKFFYDYDKQQFPININLPFNNWFAHFCATKNIIVH